jgi:hypothetical protein
MTIPDFPDADFAVARLRGPLLGELRERPRRFRRPLRIVLPALAALAIALVVALPRSSPALAVDRHDGVLELRIADATAGPEQLTEELRAAGIRGEVRLIAVPPELVGTWAAINEMASATPDGEQVTRLNRVEYGRDTLRLRAADVSDASGAFIFFAGRAARDGEAYDFDGHRFRPGFFGP